MVVVSLGKLNRLNQQLFRQTHIILTITLTKTMAAGAATVAKSQSTKLNHKAATVATTAGAISQKDEPEPDVLV